MNSRTIPQNSTFTICHEKCNPENWSVKDIMLFADFLDTGNMMFVSRLAELGISLVSSDHHVPSGGDVEQLGWTTDLDQPTFTEVHEAVENAGDEDITPLIPIYRGKTVYFAKIAYADGPDGDYSHTDYEDFQTQQAAEKRLVELLP